MDLYSLITNMGTAEFILNLSIQIIAVSLIGWIVMKLWKPRSATARSAGYLAVLISLAALPVFAAMFSLNQITWFQSTIELPNAKMNQAQAVIKSNEDETPGSLYEEPDSSFRGKPVTIPKITDHKQTVIKGSEKHENLHNIYGEADSSLKQTLIAIPDTVNQAEVEVTGDEQLEKPGNINEEETGSSFITRDRILLAANIFGGIWVAGIIVFILRLGYKLSFLKGYMYNLNTGDTERLINIYKSVKHLFKNKPIPDIYFSSSLSSPVTVGIFRPVMILPVEMENISDDELKSILLHELAHIFHRDNFIGFLQHVLSAIFWWNPLIYLLNSAYSDSREDVCDNYAINVLKSPKKYANTLLSLAEKTHFLSNMPAAAGMSLSRRSFEHRVLDLLRTDRDLSTLIKPSLIILSLIIAIVITSCGTGMKLSLKDADYPDNMEYFEISKKPVWAIGRDIINKLNTGEFEGIEEYIDYLVSQKPYTVDGTRVLEDLYLFVAVRIYSPDMLDKWCTKETPHHSAFILRGYYYIYQAKKFRGQGFAYTVTEEGLRKFKENLRLAEKDLEKAYSMNPEDPNSAVAMIRVCTGLSHDEQEMDMWFKRSIEADPVTYSAYSKKLNYIRPRWHGTPEKEKAFAEYCYNNAPPKSIIHEVMLEYIIDRYNFTGNKINYYNDPSIINTIDGVAQKTLKEFPDSTSIRKKLAEIETIKGNSEKAIELYSEILAKDPDNPKALRLRAGLYSPNLQKNDLALADLKKSFESDPDGPNNYNELAKMAIIDGKHEKAIEYYTKAIEREPRGLQYYLARGLIKMKRFENYTSALEDFREAEKQDNLLILTNFSIAVCLDKMERYEEAKKYCIKTLDILEAKKPREGIRSILPAAAENFKDMTTILLSKLNMAVYQNGAVNDGFYAPDVNFAENTRLHEHY